MRSLSERLTRRKVLTRVVGFSGGQDSIASVFAHHALWERGGDAGVYCDHGSPSVGDRVCLQNSVRYSVPGYGRLSVWYGATKRWGERWSNHKAHGRKLFASLQLCMYQSVAIQSGVNEDELRRWRYFVLLQIGLRHGYTQVVTAHTATDLIENGVFHFVFGAMRVHLFGFSVQSVARPFTSVSRWETHFFCDKYKLPIRVDSTNTRKMDEVSRNTVRYTLVPFVCKCFDKRELECHVLKYSREVESDLNFLYNICYTLKTLAFFSYYSNTVQSYVQKCLLDEYGVLMD